MGDGFGGLFRGQVRPGGFVGIALDPAAGWSHDEVVDVHPAHDLVQMLGGLVAQGTLALGAINVVPDRHAVAFTHLVQRRDQFHPGLEQPLPERPGQRPFDSGRVGVEELEVAAEVEDEEVGLVLPRPIQVGPQPGAAPEHLPEFRGRAHELEEDEVDDLWDVDAGVEHVD